MFRDLIIALSLSNLCFLEIWIGQLYINNSDKYFTKALPTINSYIALVLNVLIFSLILFLIIRFLRYINNSFFSKLAKLGLIGLFLIPLNTLRRAYTDTSLSVLLGPFLQHKILLLLAILLMLFLYIKFSNLLHRLVVTIIIILLPFIFFTFCQTGLFIFGSVMNKISIKANMKTNTVLRKAYIFNKSSSRILWIIFDALDERLTFFERPDYIKIPNLDRIVMQSVHATHAYPPGEGTPVSIPAMILGDLIYDTEPKSFDELLCISLDKKETSILERQENIFSLVKCMGYRTAAIGWYFPYCRTFAKDLDFCYQAHGEYFLTGQYNNLFENMREQIVHLLPFVNRIQHVDACKEIIANAKKIVIDPTYDLFFLHFPIPHTPGIYDATKQGFSYFIPQERWYFSNLLLVDRILGEIRVLMEDAGLWEKTTIIISSDHWYYESMKFDDKADRRIPFIIKLAGENNAITYNGSFNTILTHDLVLKILEGKVGNHNSIIKWIEENKNDYPIERVTRWNP